MAAAAARFVAAYRYIGNPRVEYGLLHLPVAFLQIAIFAAALGLAYRWYLYREPRQPLSSRTLPPPPLFSQTLLLSGSGWTRAATAYFRRKKFKNFNRSVTKDFFQHKGDASGSL
ncbi:hypothetical protein [Edaphobacter sp. 12200R-103]|uniref:hypothetical protein n=1 Tax=Edaphobacter sp. 12200R-103 TaxID=2703788 RepID=UPI00138BC5E3|nr:hypothetical protein [Edaphobacter sp. 12200R-103]QHS51991.1 hypothetical protein GWR55_09730 [Edaphobacter sp. 12200R-103]